jgi:hypothetical protein
MVTHRMTQQARSRALEGLTTRLSSALEVVLQDRGRKHIIICDVIKG